MNLRLFHIKRKSDMKKKTIKWIKLILKYLVPVVLAWFEGDTHTVADLLSELITMF